MVIQLKPLFTSLLATVLLFPAFWIGPGLCFSSKITTIQRQPHRGGFQSSLFSTTTNSNAESSLFSTTTNSNVESQYWDFKGHKCFAEVARPADNALSLFSKPKPEVILVHGFGCSTVYWRETTKYLTNAGYTVHALDLLGQGKSAKPGREQGIEYSIDLWADMVDSYAQMNMVNSKNNGIVLVGNSLGSCVALAAATGDFNSHGTPYITTKVQGVCMFNCGIGMNSRNIIRDPVWNPIQRSLLTFTFDFLDLLIFGNVPLLTFLLNKVVTKGLLKSALTGLYQFAPNPDSRVDDALVDSFYFPARDPGSVETLSQIYTNDPGKTPMEFHEDNKELSELPIQLIWGDSDVVTPIEGSVGQFYTALAETSSNVALQMLNCGHIPFDEIPECNEYLVQWLDQDVVRENTQTTSKPFFQWPFGQ
jgi:pimeloyl-ACP methyl ester carboxylesterase